MSFKGKGILGKIFILRFVYLFYLPDEGQFCETHLTKNLEFLECKYFVGFYV